MKGEPIDYGRQPTPTETPGWRAFGIVKACVLAAFVVVGVLFMWYANTYGT